MNSIQKNAFYYAILLIGAWLLGLAGESIYAPAMPAIANDLAVPVDLIKQTITFFILGKTISMIICSPIAEAFGRRQYILVGLFLFTVGGLFCTFSPGIRTLLAGRLIQGVGCSITILMGRSIVNDCFESGYAAKIFSYIFTGNAIGVVLLPVIGGYLATYIGWRYIFLILTAYGAVIFTIMWWYLPQTNLSVGVKSLQPKVLLNNYKTLITNVPYWGFLFCVAFMMAGEKAYTTSAPFLFIKLFGLSAVAYGYLTGVMWGAHLSGNLLAGWLALRAGIDRVVSVGVCLLTVASLLMIFSSFIIWHAIYIFTIAMFIYMLGTGFIIVSAAVGIVRPFPQIIGFATAFAMAMEFAISAVISYVVSKHSASLTPIAHMIGIMGLLTFIAWLLLIKQRIVKYKI